MPLRDERASELRAELDERFRDLIEEMVRDGVEAGEFSVPDTRASRDHDRHADRRDGAPGDPRRHDDPPQLHARRVRDGLRDAPRARRSSCPASRRRAMAEHILPRVGWGDVVGVAAQLIPERGHREPDARGPRRGARSRRVGGSVLVPGRGPGAGGRHARSATTGSWTRPARGWPTDDSQTERLREFLELSAADHDATNWIELWRLCRPQRVRARRHARPMADAHRRTIAGIIRAGQRTGRVRRGLARQGGARSSLR